MPIREDIKRILVIGSGPILIGQAGEFDYSGSQAVKALKSLGYYVVVINSNPATIMTDPSLSDRVYAEPIIPPLIEQIIIKEKIDAILPTVGGQTALNVVKKMNEQGMIEKLKVEILGASIESIDRAENRENFKKAMSEMELETPKSFIVHTKKEAMNILGQIDFPLILRPSFTLGGTGGGIAKNLNEYKRLIEIGLMKSPYHEILVEESLIGWKEFEFEVVRDINDNAIIVSSIENFDPMGVHTGDSITVAPAQTLTDSEYQKLRDLSLKIIRKIGVSTGGSNIQFAVNPENGDIKVIEMNPRVSRSSALVSKATGFPIAKIAAQLSVGLTLDEIKNEITEITPASFEPALDYIVVKVPRWDFKKFNTKKVLSTQMKSVGEVMAIGSNFREALQKALRSLEIGVNGLSDPKAVKLDPKKLTEKLKTPNPGRPFYIKEAFNRGFSVQKIYELTKIDPWFLENIKVIAEQENEILKDKEKVYDPLFLRKLKLSGFSDNRIAELSGKSSEEIRKLRNKVKILPVYKKVDTCAGEFESTTPYFYSTYLKKNESIPSKRKKVIVLGGGPFRIGQGIEFDYCASQAALALKKIGMETIMINCNPETVSTDYDISDKLYFEPLFLEDVMNIIELEKPFGVILQLGGQTPLKLAKALTEMGVNILGTSYKRINEAEDREQFISFLNELRIKYPPGKAVYTFKDALKSAEQIGFPVLVRPSYVLGGRGMAIVYNNEDLEKYVKEATKISKEHPILIDKFLEDAFEVDVDAISDGETVFIAGIMQHIEEAGIHSGDSSSVLPTYLVEPKYLDEIKEITVKIAKRLEIIGFINIQFAIKDDTVYVLEVNPRASRTIPFVSKSTGLPLTEVAVRLMLGEKLKEFKLEEHLNQIHYTVKAPVFSFDKFEGVDPILGPEMRSIGETMGISEFFGEAFVKAMIGAGFNLPLKGSFFISVNDYDKGKIEFISRKIEKLGFNIYATEGTYKQLVKWGIKAKRIAKVGEGKPDVLDLIKSGVISIIINTPLGRKAYQDDLKIREAALERKIPCITTLSSAKAVVDGIGWLIKHRLSIHKPLSFFKIS